MNRRSAGLTVHPDDQRPLTAAGRPARRRAGPTRHRARRRGRGGGAGAQPGAARGRGDGAGGGDRRRRPDSADLVDRYWRLVPDEDSSGAPRAEMLAATRPTWSWPGSGCPAS